MLNFPGAQTAHPFDESFEVGRLKWNSSPCVFWSRPQFARTELLFLHTNAGSTVLPFDMDNSCQEFGSCPADAKQWGRPQYLPWICTRGARLLSSTSLWSKSPWHCDHVTRCWGGYKRPDAVHPWHRDGTLAGCPLPALYWESFDRPRGWCKHEGWVWSHGSLSIYQPL